MRNIRIAMMAALLALTAGSAQADGLTVDGVTMNAGTEKNVQIVLTQDAAKYAAFQFDLVLPAGLTMRSGELVTAQTGDMTQSLKTMADGSQRFVVYSPTLATAKAGAVVTLVLKADKKADAGSYSLLLKNIVLSDTEGNKTKPADVTAPTRIAPPVKVTAKGITRSYGDGNGQLDFEVSECYTEGEPTVSCEATAASPVGSYDIVAGKGSLAADTVTLVNGTLTITPAKLKVVAQSYTRKQGEENPAFEVNYEGFVNGETAEALTKLPTVQCAATAESAVGTYDITASGAESGNYDISYTPGKLTVTKADPVTVTAKSYTRYYGEENPVFEYEANGAALQGEPLIECDATATSPVGTYTIKISKGGVKNFNDKYVAGKLTIKKAPLTITAKSYTRKQGEENPVLEVVYDGLKNGETAEVLTRLPSVSCTAKASSAPGEYEIAVRSARAANYDITFVSGKLTVTEADPVTVTAKSYSRYYGEANPTLEYEVDGAALNGEPTLSCSATAKSPVGTYPITIKKGTVKNYNDAYVDGVLTILPAPLTVTAQSYTRKQGEANPKFAVSYEGWKNRETVAVLTKQPTIVCEATEASEPGEYDIAVSDAEAANYAISYVAGKLTVTEADAVKVTAKSYTREYGEQNPTFEYNVEGAALDGEPVIECEAMAASPVGEYDIIISKGTVKNYNDTYVAGVLTITKAPLTITAQSYTRKQGEANPEFAVSYEGWKNNETETMLTKQPTIVCEATEASEPGDYDITVDGVEAANYAISYVAGKLTVTEADAVKVTAKSYTREYGEQNPTFAYDVEGAALDGEPVIECEATDASPVGEYPITIKKGGVKNYNDSYVNGVLTITKAVLTVKADSVSREQGAENPVLTVTYSGWKLSDNESVLTKQPVATTAATTDSPEGQYPVTVSGGEAENYTLVYKDGVLTVTIPACISSTTASEKPFDVWTTAGLKVRSQVMTLKGLPAGVYIVNGRKVVVKDK